MARPLSVPEDVQQRLRDALAEALRSGRWTQGSLGEEMGRRGSRAYGQRAVSDFMRGRTPIPAHAAAALHAILRTDLGGWAPPSSGVHATDALSADGMPKFGKAVADLGASEVILRWLEHLTLPADVPDETAHAVVGVLQGALSTVHGLLASAEARTSGKSRVAGSVAAPRTAPKRAQTPAPPSPPASTLESPQDGPERRQRGRR